MDAKMLQEMVEDYVMYLKSKNLARTTINMPINALQLFCESNDIELRWRKIRRMSPQQKKKSGRSAYSTEDIRKMLNFEPKLRNKAILHFMASTGIRVGAITDLRIKHLKNMSDGCMAITVYPDDLEEYTTFLTPEATTILNSYFDKRRSDGELVDDNSPVFREQYAIGMVHAYCSEKQNDTTLGVNC